MQEISAAIQAGAKAYLNRQYATISMAGVVLLVLIGLFIGWTTATGFAIGAIFSGLTGYIGMNVSVRANVRTTEAANHGLNAAMQIAFRGGAITGMLVVGLALLGVAGFYGILVANGVEDPIHPLIGPVLAAAFSPRARMSAQTSSARWKPVSLKMTHATLLLLLTTSVITSVTARAWPPTCSRPMP